MEGVSDRNFGLLIAYIVPGVIVLWGLSLLSPVVTSWLSGPVDSGPTIGGVLYITIASVGAGMIASVFRWLTIDQLHHATGLKRPAFNDQKLHERHRGYQWIIENHYRYYQCYGNSIIALVFAQFCEKYVAHQPAWSTLDTVLFTINIALLAGSRSALSHYYHRADKLLGSLPQGDSVMTNGGHPKPPVNPKPQTSKPTEAKKPTPAK